jgi:endonuclease/exonuclease/phosphatase family metal-dependent hydrolase
MAQVARARLNDESPPAAQDWSASPRAVDPDVLHIASYNIHRCVGTDMRCDVERVATVIRELGCDTIGLQEVDSQPSERSDSMQLEYLATATGMQQVAGTTLIRHDREYGNGLLTRRKILDVKRHDLSYGRYEPRGALEVDLDVQGHVIRVFVMHLGLLPSERSYQMRKVLETLRQIPSDQPVVVLGDINEWMPLGRPLRWLHTLLGKPPWQRTFPVWAPMFALDRVWVRPVGSLLDFRVHRSPVARRASDHFPVTARVLPAAVPLREREA